MKISTFIITCIVASLIVTGLSLMMSDLSGKHSISYNESEIEVYNTLLAQQNLTHQLEEKVLNQSTNQGALDLVGNFIGQVVDALKLAKGSYTTFNVMASKGIDQLGLPNIFKIALFAIVLILIVFAIIGAMLKKDV